MRILLLGGTSEAAALALALSDAGLDSVYSYAGRTAAPRAIPLPTRSAGFGGVSGLRGYLEEHSITHVVDATHPFAAQMSRNAAAACAALQCRLIRLERPPWTPVEGDTWQHFESLEAIAAALPERPERVFLAIGRQQIDAFASRPEHFYLLRFVDPPEGPLSLPNVGVEVARGPFEVGSEEALLERHRIERIVTKNAGGQGAVAKLAAARRLGLPVMMVDRPVLPEVLSAASVDEVMEWLHHGADLGV